jgi:hypothetical protein
MSKWAQLRVATKTFSILVLLAFYDYTEPRLSAATFNSRVSRYGITFNANDKQSEFTLVREANK